MRLSLKFIKNYKRKKAIYIIFGLIIVRWLRLKPLDHMTKKRYLGSNHCLRREYAKCIYIARAGEIT
jgi:hypothetical protein